MSRLEELQGRELKRIEQEMRNHHAISLGVLLIAAIYSVFCVIVWQMVAGIPNGIDDDDGLPVVYDAFMVASLLLVNLMALTTVRSIHRWVPRRFKGLKRVKGVESPWDIPPSNVAASFEHRRLKAPRPMPGPPATKDADKS